MTFRVRERLSDRVERTITMSLRLYPGVFIPSPNPRRGPRFVKVDPVDLEALKLRRALSIVRTHDPLWRSFELVEGESAITYRFELRVEVDENPTPVCALQWNDSYGDDLDRFPHARRATSLIEEASAHGFDNVAVVYPLLRNDPNATRIQPDRTIVCPRFRGELMDTTSNFVRLSYEQISREGNLTAAHEIGHLLGLGHGRARDAHAPGAPLMVSRDGLERSMHESDQLNLHRCIAELGREHGVIWEGSRPERTRRARGGSATSSRRGAGARRGARRR